LFLEEGGKKQALPTVKSLRKFQFEVIYTFTFPQRRALDTTKLIVERLNLHLKVDERLKEIFYGILEGKKHLEVENWEPYQKWLEDPIKNPLEGVDNLFEVQGRVLEFLKELSEEKF